MNTEINNSSKLESLGVSILRYGLVLVLLWVGALKFTSYEAEGIKPLVMNSPFLSWAYSITSVTGFAKVLGTIEIILGILIASRRFSPRVSVIGSIGAMFMFFITLTFLFTTPPVWQPGYGFPFLSPMPGQFLIKDILFFGAATYTAGEAASAANLTLRTYRKSMYA